MIDDSIYLQLRMMNSDELQKVLGFVLKRLGENPSGFLTNEEQLAFTGYTDALFKKLRTKLYLPKGILVAEFKKGYLLTEFWLQNSEIKLRRDRIVPWFQFFGELVLEFCERNHIPVSLKVMIMMMKKIPEFVDHAFPGYIERNLLINLLEAYCHGGVSITPP